MALPRWVPDPHVDSAAMLSAVLWFRGSQRPVWDDLGCEGRLTSVDHGTLAVPTGGVLSVRCPRPQECRRCVEGRSGYTFRWASALWFHKYCELARPNAWKGSEEGIPLRVFTPSMQYLTAYGELCDSTGRRLEEGGTQTNDPSYPYRGGIVGELTNDWRLSWLANRAVQR